MQRNNDMSMMQWNADMREKEGCTLGGQVLSFIFSYIMYITMMMVIVTFSWCPIDSKCALQLDGV